MVKLKQTISGFAANAAGRAAGAADAVRAAAADPRVRRTVDAAARAGGSAVHAAAAVGRKAPAAVRDIAERTGPAILRAAGSTGEAVRAVAGKAAPIVADAVGAAGSAASSAVRAAAEQVRHRSSGASMADPRPHERIDPKTGQKVVCEAYVLRPDGTRDYDAVFPEGSRGDFGPLGNKAVGVALVAAGIPMLVLPGPGMAAIMAGMYYLTKESERHE